MITTLVTTATIAKMTIAARTVTTAKTIMIVTTAATIIRIVTATQP